MSTMQGHDAVQKKKKERKRKRDSNHQINEKHPVISLDSRVITEYTSLADYMATAAAKHKNDEVVPQTDKKLQMEQESPVACR